MQYFHKKYYTISSREQRQNTRIDRYNYDSTIRTGLEIRPIDQSNIFELFYIPTNETINLLESIIKYDARLQILFSSIPGVAKEQFILEIVTEELYITNELEGVKSSRDEIVRSTKGIMENKKTKSKRFNSLIKSYLGLINNSFRDIDRAEDYREIYDEITLGEIKKSELPDGKIFRKDMNYVFNKREQEIHRGVYPEKEIIEKLNQLIEFMNNEKREINNLIKIAIEHYYFGYIHPFYDGNGRTSRFISSSNLAKELSVLTGLSLARGCYINDKKYAEAFDKTNKIISSGEMNFFVDSFLGIIKVGQEDLLVGLKEKLELLNIAFEKIENDKRISDIDEEQIMSAIIQNHYFNVSDQGVIVKDLTEFLSRSESTIRKKLRILEKKDLIKKIKSNPLVYVLSIDFLEG